MISAVIFDLDGTLIDSEPFWKEAEKNVFTSLGVSVTEALSSETASMTTLEVVDFWYKKSPWSRVAYCEVEQLVVDQVINMLKLYGTSLKGVSELLSLLKAKNIKIGLATNSPKRIIPVAIEKIEAQNVFDAICSSEDEKAGKPDPSVYLTAADKLGVDPSECLVFEDTFNGALAAFRAKMKTVLVSPNHLSHENVNNMFELRLACLSEFGEKEWELLFD